MRGAGVRPAHVLRAVVYGCDFGLTAIAALCVLFVPPTWAALQTWSYEHVRPAVLSPTTLALLAAVVICATRDHVPANRGLRPVPAVPAAAGDRAGHAGGRGPGRRRDAAVDGAVVLIRGPAEGVALSRLAGPLAARAAAADKPPANRRPGPDRV